MKRPDATLIRKSRGEGVGGNAGEIATSANDFQTVVEAHLNLPDQEVDVRIFEF